AARKRRDAGGAQGGAPRNSCAARRAGRALDEDPRRARRARGVRPRTGRRDPEPRAPVQRARREARSDARTRSRQAPPRDQGHDHARVPLLVLAVRVVRRRRARRRVSLPTPRSRRVTRSRPVAILAVLLVAAVALVAAELVVGATHTSVKIANACEQ